ncbi:MAG: hypothetical protein RBS37_10805 [Bacteroidales bacterium]|jgi:hypothetical protein|nr:hypothetical protein [Bacteroidales bacterium]
MAEGIASRRVSPSARNAIQESPDDLNVRRIMTPAATTVRMVAVNDEGTGNFFTVRFISINILKVTQK